jgi:farnesyl diphosphate synthase
VHRAYDEATAILAGDALLTLAFAHLGEHGAEDPAIRARLVVELAASAGAGGMVGGQMRDIEGETTHLTQLDIARMQAMKTGALIRAAIRMGAILAGADRDTLGHLTAYAEAAGRAFQLADDLLDVTASAEAMGKATGKDAGRNKQTLVSVLGADAARRHLGDIVHDAITALTPFGLPAPLTIYCDVSLKIYGEVIPAGGSTHASVRLPLGRLAALCGNLWADACDVPAS